MNIQAALEREHSKTVTTAIVNYIGKDSERFKTLMDVFLNGDSRLSQRAAWPVSFACIAEPSLVKPYLAKLVNLLKEPVHHPAIRRNILRLFQEIEIPEKHQAALINECFRLIADPSQPVAVVAFAITNAAKLCKPFPELGRELKLVLHELSTQPHTPAIRVRIKKALKDLS